VSLAAPDPYSGVTYFCNFTRPYEINSKDCRIKGVGYECLFCLLGPGGGAYPITVVLEGQRSVTSLPFKFRGRAVGLAFHEKPSKLAPKDGKPRQPALVSTLTLALILSIQLLPRYAQLFVSLHKLPSALSLITFI
jgi:hypothetical protein